MRSLSSVLANAIVANLNEHTAKFDGREGARAKPGKITAYKAADGAIGYKVIITQDIMPDVVENKRKQIQQQQVALKSKLASKNGVMALLRSGGVQ